MKSRCRNILGYLNVEPNAFLMHDVTQQKQQRNIPISQTPFDCVCETTSCTRNFHSRTYTDNLPFELLLDNLLIKTSSGERTKGAFSSKRLFQLSFEEDNNCSQSFDHFPRRCKILRSTVHWMLAWERKHSRGYDNGPPEDDSIFEISLKFSSAGAFKENSFFEYLIEWKTRSGSGQ